MVYAYRAYTDNQNKLTQEELKRSVFYYMAMIVEMAHSFSRKTNGELSEILGLSESELSAIEHADLTKALSSYQLENWQSYVICSWVRCLT